MAQLFVGNLGVWQYGSNGRNRNYDVGYFVISEWRDEIMTILRLNIKKCLIMIAVVCLVASLSGCKAKDIVSLSGIGKNDFYVGDRFGNKVKVDNGEEYLDILRQAGAAKDLSDKEPGEAEYFVESGGVRIYYDSQAKTAIYIDKNQKRHVYAADLDSLISKVTGLPPSIVMGTTDSQINAWMKDLSKVIEPTAMVFEKGEEIIVAVMAGEKSTSGNQLLLDKVSMTSGVLKLDIRLQVPQTPSSLEPEHPYIVMTVAKDVETDIRLVHRGATGDQLVHVPVTRASQSQKVILARPEKGALLTERVRLSGFAADTIGSLTVEVEDGHDILGKMEVILTQGTAGWNSFDFYIDLQPATNSFGTIIFVTTGTGGSQTEELLVPVSFGGK